MRGEFVIDETVDGIRRAKVVERGSQWWIVAGPNCAVQLMLHGAACDHVPPIVWDMRWDFGLHLPWTDEPHGGVEMEECDFIDGGRCIFFAHTPVGLELGTKVEAMTDTPRDLACFEVLRDYYDLIPPR